MPENLNKGEVIATIPMEEVATIKEIIAERHSIGGILDYAMMRNRNVIMKESKFWEKIREDYMIDMNTQVYIDFKTGELRRG